jgi:hypothetical protein
MDATVSTPLDRPDPVRSPADRRMRRVLRLPEDGPRVSFVEAQNAFSKSMYVSATRCLLTYIVLPVLAPLVDLSGGVGPVLGLVLSLVSMVAIVAATRRFFAADHAWRWRYTLIGGGVFVLLVVQAVVDATDLGS